MNKIDIFLKITLHILLGIFLGGGLTLFHLSHNGTLQQYVEKKIQHDFEKKYGCRLQCRLDKINWLSLRMVFSQVCIEPFMKDQEQADVSDWSIMAETFTLKFSWFSLITSFTLKVSGVFEHMIMHESCETAFQGLFEFLGKIFVREPGDVIQYDYVTISDGLLSLTQRQDAIQCYIPYTCNMSVEAESARVQLYTQKGYIEQYNKKIISNITGSIVSDVPDKDVVRSLYAHVNIESNILSLGEKGKVFFTGTISNGRGDFVAKNDDQSFVVDPISIRVDSEKCLLDLSIITNSDLCKQLHFYEMLQDLHGTIRIDCRADLYQFFKTFQLDVSINDVEYKKRKFLHDGKLFVQYQSDGVQGQFFQQEKSLFEFLITSLQKKVAATFVNCTDLMISEDLYLKIPAKSCRIEVMHDSQQGWVASYRIELQNFKLQETKIISGTCVLQEQNLLLQGFVKDVAYDICIQLNPEIFLKRVLFTKDKKKLVNFYTNEANIAHLIGMVDYEAVQNIVPEMFKSSFAQEGIINFEGYVKDGIYLSELCTKNANIRIPKIYNVIQDVTAKCEIDIYNRLISFKDIKAQLHEGEISCSQANFFFNKSGECFFVHVPCFLHNVLMSWDKGIFVLLSGGLLVTKSAQKRLGISGQLIIEKSQLKDNILSTEFQEKFISKPVEKQEPDQEGEGCLFDISVFTKELLQIKTSFLSAKSKVDLLLQGSIYKPLVSGMLQIISGSFYFPYKSLEIIDGKIFVVAGHQVDPLLEVTAKGKLKRYSVTMRVSGSVFDPYVHFDATPYLTEEQIVSLLLLGIEDSSVSMLVPALLSQKLKDIIFGPALSKTKLKLMFDRVLNSLKYFRFLPQFTSQSGRGGLRGIFEVDASDHLRGKVDVNFMQLEDTKFDIDFDVTDDITLRAQRDGPSTYGGEVEFRWKFG